ncbi:MAG: hypothetical protein ABIS69_10735 [Sediminibacterium sp.]
MKPNLFRSISNSLAEIFPLLPRIRRSFIGLLMFCLLFLLIGFSESEGVTMQVIPVKNGKYHNKPVTIYSAGSVTVGGQFRIINPSLGERILLPNVSTDLDMITLVFLSIMSIIIIIVTPKLQQQHLFRKNISDSIRVLGYLMILHGIINIYRTIVYSPRKIELLTNNEFTTQHGFPVIICAELYFSLIVIALAGFYERGIKLQQEHDLTV